VSVGGKRTLWRVRRIAAGIAAGMAAGMAAGPKNSPVPITWPTDFHAARAAVIGFPTETD
jgi:hypothetical protein